MIYLAFYVNATHNHAVAVAVYSNSSLPDILDVMNGIMKDNNVSVLHFPVRQEMAPEAVIAEMQFVHQQVIADEEGILLGLRRNLERLHHKRDHKDRDHHRSQQRLKGFRPT